MGVRRLVFFAIVHLSSVIVNAQKSNELDVDFREIVTIQSCESANDKAECFYDFIEKEVIKTLKEEIETEIKKDTVWVGISFDVDKKGRLGSKVNVSVNTKKARQINARLKDFLNSLEPYQISTKKQKRLTIRHLMEFRYSYRWENKGVYKQIPPETPYSGGQFYEWASIFGEKSKNPRTRRENLYQELNNYIINNFLYINFIKEFNLKGRFRLHLTFNKDGNVEKFHTNEGLSKLLKDEFYRIFKTMPPIQPTKINGEPQTTVFSIPITIK